MMILAGDMGGTKCNLGLFRRDGSWLREVFTLRLATREFAECGEVVEEFLRRAERAGETKLSIDAAGFGVAGVVAEGRHFSANLPWPVDGAALGRILGLTNITLLNDLAATAWSLEKLPARDFVVLNQGEAAPRATKAVIAAGTGLGEALLFWDGTGHQVAAAEGGHADFAPRSTRELELLIHLRAGLPHVSCEQIVSGRGFLRIHEFLEPGVRHESFTSAGGNAAAEITQRGLARTCGACVETLQFWTEILGGVAGNFALQTMAVGGVYIAGGIAAKILPLFLEGAFQRSFCGSGPMAETLARIPIAVVLNEDAPLWGAAYEAMKAVSGA